MSKLLFSFINPKIEAMTMEYLSSPSECIRIPKGKEKQSLMITFGLHSLPGKAISIYSSIYAAGMKVPVNTAKAGDGGAHTLRATLLPDGMGVFLMAMEANDVVFEGDGMYEIDLRIFPADEKPSKDNEIDSLRNFFLVLTSEGEQDGSK
ncbi:hypothetical protein QMU90_002798 [Edwardsiella ictaluri]|uniref:hypothetical protein n=1 Tax=Edwardsiella tarda TaxID=636 RepID=UPI0029A47EE7|nr:hypothetical protein [Edwardsiella ictaluri]